MLGLVGAGQPQAFGPVTESSVGKTGCQERGAKNVEPFLSQHHRIRLISVMARAEPMYA